MHLQSTLLTGNGGPARISLKNIYFPWFCEPYRNELRPQNGKTFKESPLFFFRVGMKDKCGRTYLEDWWGQVNRTFGAFSHLSFRSFQWLSQYKMTLSSALSVERTPKLKNIEQKKKIFFFASLLVLNLTGGNKIWKQDSKARKGTEIL